MEIELARLTHVPLVVRGPVLVREDERDGTGRTLARDGIHTPQPLELDAKVWKSGDRVVVAGHVEGSVRIECGRCLTSFPHRVDVDFESKYAPAGAAAASDPRSDRTRRASAEEDEGVQLAVDDLDVSFLPRGAATLDLAEVAREQLLLDLPLRPLCKVDCAGLCARCGQDLNEGACPCPPDDSQPGDPRLWALAELRKKLGPG